MGYVNKDKRIINVTARKTLHRPALPRADHRFTLYPA
jgi:hypothetical protein